jgi:hypothetical protein
MGSATSSPVQHEGGFYANRIFPWLNDRLARDPELERTCGETLAPARGSTHRKSDARTAG